MATCPSSHKQFAQFVQDRLIGGSGDLLLSIQSATNEDAQHIAMTLIMPIITLELMFIGARLAMKESFVKQFAEFTIAALIAYIIIFMQWPQNLILKYEQKLRKGGMDWGYKIASFSPGGVADPDPVVYWGSWLGIPNEADSKYNGDFIMQTIFGEAPPPKPPAASSSSAADVGGPVDIMYLLFKENVLDRLPDAPTIGSALSLLMGPIFMAVILVVTMTQITGYLAPVVAQISMLTGSLFLLRFYLSIGLVAMPLLFFKNTKDIWIHYLKFAVGVALIPSFYYILSGVGYFFATTIFDVLFPAGGGGAGMGKTIKDMVESGIKWNTENFLGGLSSTGVGGFASGMQDLIAGIIRFFMRVFGKLIFLTSGTVVVTAVVGGGVAFSAMAPQFALSWEKAFANEGMLEVIKNVFGGIQKAFTTGLSQGYTQLTSTMTNVIFGFIGGLKSRLRPGGGG